MVKQRRMGRNLDALLGGSARSRQSGSAISDNNKAGSRAVGTDTSAPAAAQVSTAEAGGNSATSELSTGQGSASVRLGGEAEQTSLFTEAAESESSAASTDRLRMIGVDQIRRGTYQPRRLFDPELLEELADSIKVQGMIQPIIVRRFAGAFELVAGERRWRAAQLAGLSEIPAIVREMEDKSVAAVALIENIQRKDLNPLEEAAAFQRLCDEFGMTHKAVADSVGRSRASVSNLMRLLELHDDVKLLVDRGELEMGHARAILGASHDKQHGIAKQVISDGLTVRAVEKLVRDLNEGKPEQASGRKAVVADPDIERLSKKLGDTLGAAVKIQHRPSGAGKLEVRYSSVAELQGILAHIK